MNLSIFTYTNDSKMYSNYELFLSSKVVTKKRMVTFATHFISRRILAQFWRSNVRASQVYLWSTTNKMQRFLYLFISINCCTCFRRFLRPSPGAQNCTCSVRYCQTNTAASCYRGWDGTEFPLIHDSSSIGLTIPDAAFTVLCSWWWAEEPPETCRAIYRNK